MYYINSNMKISRCKEDKEYDEVFITEEQAMRYLKLKLEGSFPLLPAIGEDPQWGSELPPSLDESEE